MTWAIKLEGVTKVYPIYTRPLDRLREMALFGLRKHHQELFALKDVSLEVEAGTTLGIIGRNGAGKSTLLKILSGNLAPTTGTVSVRGRISSILELGMGFQPGLTGRQNIRINALLLGLRPREIDACFQSVIEFAEIGDAIDRPLSTYSTGMAGRLAFSILSAVRSEVVILDEALAAGDAGFVEKSRKLINNFRDSGSTVLVVSHDMKVMREICDRVVWIDHGAVRDDGDAIDVVERYLRALPELAHMFSPEEGTLAPTRLLFWLTPTAGVADEASFPIGALEWHEVRAAPEGERREVLGRGQPQLDFHMEESVRGARENGLDAETARRGWGEVADVHGRPTRLFRFPGGRPVAIALHTPQRSHGGRVQLSVVYCDTSKVPLRLEVSLGGATRVLGEVFGAGDGAWKELALPLPDECRFDTLGPPASRASAS